MQKQKWVTPRILSLDNIQSGGGYVSLMVEGTVIGLTPSAMLNPPPTAPTIPVSKTLHYTISSLCMTFQLMASGVVNISAGSMLSTAVANIAPATFAVSCP